MNVDDKVLLDFDKARLADFDEDRTKRNLAAHGEAFRSQLAAAIWIDGWRERFKDRAAPEEERSFADGVDYALREVVAHLRQGDLLPNGALIRDEFEPHG